MKSLKAVLLCGLMAISGQSFAKPPTDIEIKFKKGDYCAIYQIDTRSDLHIYLNKNQKFTINLIAGIAKPYLTTAKVVALNMIIAKYIVKNTTPTNRNGNIILQARENIRLDLTYRTTAILMPNLNFVLIDFKKLFFWFFRI